MLNFILFLDNEISKYFLSLQDGSFFDLFMAFITHLGDNGYIWIALAAILLIMKPTRRMGAFLLVILASVYVLNDLFLKNIFLRTRPYEAFGIAPFISGATGHSFPSGHSATSFACAMFLFEMNKKKGIFALILAFLIGFSRIYLLAHYSSDVIFGAVEGIMVGMVFAIIYRKYTKVKKST